MFELLLDHGVDVQLKYPWLHTTGLCQTAEKSTAIILLVSNSASPTIEELIEAVETGGLDRLKRLAAKGLTSIP